VELVFSMDTLKRVYGETYAGWTLKQARLLQHLLHTLCSVPSAHTPSWIHEHCPPIALTSHHHHTDTAPPYTSRAVALCAVCAAP
jgi:hypothetical protein